MYFGMNVFIDLVENYFIIDFVDLYNVLRYMIHLC